MKAHSIILQQTAAALEEIFFENRYADKVIEKYLKSQKKWGSRDRKFFAESVYSCVRWWRYYLELLQLAKPERKDFMQVIATDLYLRKSIETPELRSGFATDLVNRKKELLEQNDISILQSFPDWWVSQGIQQTNAYLQSDFCKTHNDELQKNFINCSVEKFWGQLLNELNQEAPVDLRVNTLRVSVEAMKELIFEKETEAEKILNLDSGLTLKERKNVFHWEEFKKGFFEIQDRSSQRVAPFLKLEPGLRVLDGCAGAGGKTLHMGTLMKNKGKIVALDIFDWKLEELRRRASRNGLDLIETKLIENSKVLKRMENSFDRVLVDAPCSGSGVIRRNPDAKWKMNLERIDELMKTQSELLQTYSAMVKPGGYLVYSTCSVFPRENQMQIDQFLKAHADFSIEEMQTIFPNRIQQTGDGFFLVRLKKLL